MRKDGVTNFIVFKRVVSILTPGVIPFGYFLYECLYLKCSIFYATHKFYNIENCTYPGFLRLCMEDLAGAHLIVDLKLNEIIYINKKINTKQIGE